MFLRHTTIVLGMCCVMLFATDPCHAGPDQPTTMSVDPSVAGFLDSFAEAKVDKPIDRIEVQSLTVQPPNESSSASNLTYAHVGKNTWGVRTTSSSPAGEITTETLSLCGLIELLSTANSVTRTNTPVVVPIGRVFSAFSISTTMEVASRSRVTRLTVDANSAPLCTPVTAQPIVFEVESEFEGRYGIGTSSEKTVKANNAISWVCSVEAAKPASSLFPALSGDYLPVSCNGVNKVKGVTNASKYAFLVDSGMYVRLETTIPTLRDKRSISRVDYLVK